MLLRLFPCKMFHFASAMTSGVEDSLLINMLMKVDATIDDDNAIYFLYRQSTDGRSANFIYS